MDPIFIRLHKLQKAIPRVTVMSRIGLQAELAMHEDDGVSLFQKVLCRSRSACASTKVVNESNCLRLQWHGRSSTLCWVHGEVEIEGKESTMGWVGG